MSSDVHELHRWEDEGGRVIEEVDEATSMRDVFFAILVGVVVASCVYHGLKK